MIGVGRRPLSTCSVDGCLDVHTYHTLHSWEMIPFSDNAIIRFTYYSVLSPSDAPLSSLIWPDDDLDAAHTFLVGLQRLFHALETALYDLGSVEDDLSGGDVAVFSAEASSEGFRDVSVIGVAAEAEDVDDLGGGFVGDLGLGDGFLVRVHDDDDFAAAERLEDFDGEELGGGGGDGVVHPSGRVGVIDDRGKVRS